MGIKMKCDNGRHSNPYSSESQIMLLQTLRVSEPLIASKKKGSFGSICSECAHMHMYRWMRVARVLIVPPLISSSIQ